MKKVLYTATTSIHLKNFHIPYLKWFHENGFEVHVAFNGVDDIAYSDYQWNVPFGRSPTSLSNIKAFNKLKYISSQHKYDVVHCHTPMGGVITRLALASSRNSGTKVLYTSHGFHFYKGAPIKFWLLFFPIEWMLAFISDGIITINQEDYDILKKFSFQTEGKYKINGIGIDPVRLTISQNVNKQTNRHLYNLEESDIVILYIAEFISRKNHTFILENISKIISKNPNCKFVFAGGGVLLDSMKEKSKDLGISDHTVFLGYRNDIGNIISVADIGISSSKQEGLGLGVAELMFNGIPVVVSEDRGHKELVNSGYNGLMFKQNDNDGFVKAIQILVDDVSLRKEFGDKGKESMQKFLVDKSLKQMIEIYKDYV